MQQARTILLVPLPQLVHVAGVGGGAGARLQPVSTVRNVPEAVSYIHEGKCAELLVAYHFIACQVCSENEVVEEY